MDTGQRESRKPQINPVRKYIWCQQVGMAIFFAWPVAIMLASMFDLDYIVVQMSVLMVGIAVLIFAIGHVGREELAERRRTGK
jgi:hypothetical protein